MSKHNWPKHIKKMTQNKTRRCVSTSTAVNSWQLSKQLNRLGWMRLNCIQLRPWSLCRDGKISWKFVRRKIHLMFHYDFLTLAH